MRYVLAYAGGGTDIPPGWERHLPLWWRDFEAAPNVYRWPDVAIEAPPKRLVHLELVISLFNWGQPPIDYTPTHRKSSLALTGDGTSARPPGEIPNYADPHWVANYITAITALATRYREDSRVAAYWLSLGWNAETCAAGSGYEVNAKPLLAEADYLRFVSQVTAAALEAWGPKPVYIAGAAAPGNVWGKLDRYAIVAALQAGARYRNCALKPDQDNSYGVGLHAGTMLYDSIPQAPGCAFENGLVPDTAHPMQLYWMLLRALRWQADFVDLYRAWIPLYDAVVGLLPPADARWIVFRDQEYPVQTWGDYGLSGEPGVWTGGGLVGWDKQPTDRLTFAGADEYNFGRWRLSTAGLRLRLFGWGAGEAAVTLWRPDGTAERITRAVADETLTLPAGEYHRVDVVPVVAQVPTVSNVEQRLTALELLLQQHTEYFERLRAALGV